MPESFLQMALQTKCVKRRGKVDPFEFFIALTFGHLSALRPTLTSYAQGLAEAVSRQAIDQRFTPEAVRFFEASFAHVLAKTLDWSPAEPQANLLRGQFKAVYLLDSTCFDTAESLQKIFPSCGGAGSAANVKVLLRYELISGRLEPLRMLAGKRSDQGQAWQAAERLLEGELQLQDKGFYDAKAWQAAEDRKAFLLMPLPHSVTLRRSPGEKSGEEPVDLAALLRASSADMVEEPRLFLGGKGHQTPALRLVCFRLSPESAERQRRGLRESLRTKGRVPTEKALELAGWLLLLTNAPVEKLPSAMMSFLYRARWQIELIFRQLKTVLRIHESESSNSCRVQCEIWARLACAVLLFLWHSHASAECWLLHQCEASFEKVIRILQQWGQVIARAFLGGPKALLEVLREIWKHLLRNARKGKQKSRSSTWENLFALWLSKPATAA